MLAWCEGATPSDSNNNSQWLSVDFSSALLTWPSVIDQQLHQIPVSPAVIQQLIDTETLVFKKQYKNSKHEVAIVNHRGKSLHVKPYPDQPMMDYGIDLLHRRLIGHGTPANVLAKLELQVQLKNSPKKDLPRIIHYPILISTTIPGINLREALKTEPALQIDHYYYTELVLVALLTLAGDGSSRNWVLTKVDGRKTLVSVDNEQHFVEPLVKANRFSKENVVQFQQVLFTLAQANIPLERKALEKFVKDRNSYFLINRWQKDLQQRQQAYLDLYPDMAERNQLYQRSKDEKTTVRFLIREGVMGNLLLNENWLKNHIKDILQTNQPIKALDLLSALNVRLGDYFSKAYQQGTTPDKRLEVATGAPQASISSRLALQASLGLVPVFEDIEKSERYSLKQAEKELYCLADFKPDFSKLVDTQGKPDLNQQWMLLKALALYPHKQLSLSHCAILDDAALKLVLANSKQLSVLDLRACPKLTVNGIRYVALAHPTLQMLYLSDNPAITAIDNGGLLIKQALSFPNLIELRLSRCVNLETLQLDAPKLSQLKHTDCPKLVLPSNEATTLTDVQKQNSQEKKSLSQLSFVVSPNKTIQIIIWVDDEITSAIDIDTKSYYYKKHAIHRHLYQGKNSINSIKANFFNEINILFILYDAFNSKSLKNVEAYYSELLSQLPKPIPLILVNKSEKFGLITQDSIPSIEYTDLRAFNVKLFEDAPQMALAFYRYKLFLLRYSQLDFSSNILKFLVKFPLTQPENLSDSLAIEKSLKVIIFHTGDACERCITKYASSISLGFMTKKIQINQENYRIHGWETSKKRFQMLGRDYFRKYYDREAVGYLVILPVDNPDEFKELAREALELIQANTLGRTYVLIGCSIDKRDESHGPLSYDEARATAKQYGYTAYFECSEYTGENFEEAFKYTFELMFYLTGYWAWKNIPYQLSATAQQGLLININSFPEEDEVQSSDRKSTIKQFIQSSPLFQSISSTLAPGNATPSTNNNRVNPKP